MRGKFTILAAVCALALGCNPLFAEAATGNDGKDPDGKILRITFKDELSQLTLGILDDTSDRKVCFKPNNPLVLKLGAQYGKLGGDLGVSTGQVDNHYDIHTRCLDLHGFLYKKRWGADAYFQQYKGFYLEDNTDEVYPGLEIDTATISGYLKIAGSSGLNAFKDPIVSKRPIAVLAYALASVSYRSIDSNDPLIPSGETGEFADLADVRKFSAIIPSLSAGTLLSMHVWHFYFNPGLSIGFGYPCEQSRSGTGPRYSIKMNIKARTGYEGKRYLAGIEVSDDSDSIMLRDKKSINFSSVIVNIYAGRKFILNRKGA